MQQQSDREVQDWGYAAHAPPILEEDGEVLVIRVPDESGYFPTGTKDGVLLSCEAQLFQMHPKYLTRRDRPISAGTLSLRDPSDGTASEVALVCECDGTSFYVREEDATKKIGPTEFMLLLPEDCIGVELSDDTAAETVLHFEALLAARTKFHDESSQQKSKDVVYPENLPEDKTARTMWRMAKWTAKMIVKTSDKAAVAIDDYGQKKTASVTDIQEKEVKKSHIKMAEKTRKISEKSHAGVEQISDKISSVVGKSVAKHTTIKAKDSEKKKTARKMLLASTIAYGEVSDGAGEGYSIMARSAKKQAVSFVEKKYGRDAAELARHTAGAAVNFGSAALTARRVVNVKKIVKSGAKQTVKNAILK